MSRRAWTQDLSEEVRVRTNAALIAKTTPKTTPDTTADERAIDDAVRTNVEVVRQHRLSIGSAHALAMTMLDDLKVLRESIDDILEAIEDETKDDRLKNGKFNPKRRKAMVRALGLREQAQTLSLICSILAKVIPLERKAFNLDSEEADDDENTLTKLRREISGRCLRPVEVDAIGDGDTAA